MLQFSRNHIFSIKEITLFCTSCWYLFFHWCFSGEWTTCSFNRIKKTAAACKTHFYPPRLATVQGEILFYSILSKVVCISVPILEGDGCRQLNTSSISGHSSRAGFFYRALPMAWWNRWPVHKTGYHSGSHSWKINLRGRIAI